MALAFAEEQIVDMATAQVQFWPPIHDGFSRNVWPLLLASSLVLSDPLAGPPCPPLRLPFTAAVTGFVQHVHSSFCMLSVSFPYVLTA